MKTVPVSTPVFDRQSTPAFNHWMRWVTQRIGHDVETALPGSFVALILGGGFGRGEGGIVLVDNVEQPYNDLDFTLIVRRREKTALHALHAISDRYASELHVDVDFSRPLTVADIRRWPAWLMWQDLLNGHIVVRGPSDILTANASPILQRPLPLIEATRLLLNRGAGLLWALRIVKGIERAPDSDFIRRNYFKCALALGDALMIAYERYATPYTGRDERLSRLINEEAGLASLFLEDQYRDALLFKFRPDCLPDLPISESDIRTLAERWGQVFLLVERKRTAFSWTSLSDYAGWNGYREAEQNHPGKWPRNVVQNWRMGRWSSVYPRETLYSRLPALFGLADHTPSEWDRASEAFLQVWRNFN